MPQFADARAVSPENLGGVIQLARSIQQYVGVTPRLITRPSDTRILTIRCESGTIRIRPGDYRGVSFRNTGTLGVIVGGTDTIADLTAHGFVSGEGPFQITMADGVMTPGTPVVIDETTDQFIRSGGSWNNDGFAPNHPFTVEESASNDGAFTSANPTGAPLLTVAEDITVGEVSQTDLVIIQPGVLALGLALLIDFWVIRVDADTIALASSLVNALADSRVNIGNNGAGHYTLGGPAGWAANAVAAASKTDGYGSVAIVAGETISFPAPAELTMVGLGATDACTYWFGR